MKISTRGRYALRVMTDIAEHSDGAYIPLKEISERQNISLKYLESIMASLSKAGYIDGMHGKGGGYRLSKSADEYKVGDILRITEGSIAPVACLEDGAKPCKMAAECRTIKMWKKFDEIINEFFDGYTISDLMKNTDGGNYII